MRKSIWKNAEMDGCKTWVCKFNDELLQSFLYMIWGQALDNSKIIIKEPGQNLRNRPLPWHLRPLCHPCYYLLFLLLEAATISVLTFPLSFFKLNFSVLWVDDTQWDCLAYTRHFSPVTKEVSCPRRDGNPGDWDKIPLFITIPNSPIMKPFSYIW